MRFIMSAIELQDARSCFNQCYGQELSELQIQILNKEFSYFLPMDFDNYLIECYKQPYAIRMELISITYKVLDPLLEDIVEYQTEYDEELAEECLEQIIDSKFIQKVLFEKKV